MTGDPFARDRAAQMHLDGAAHARSEIADYDAELLEHVRAARQHGATWAQIGRALGTTRTAAQKRYGHQS